MRSIWARILTWPLRHPSMTIGATLLCALLAFFGARQLCIDPSLKAMFGRDNSAAVAMSRVMEDFGAVDELLVMASLRGERQSTPADVDRLIRFGDRLAAAIPASPQASALVQGAYDRPQPDAQRYFERTLAPAALYYLDDAAFSTALRRLTRGAMNEQLAQDAAMMTAPGAAGGLAKAMMRDPLRLQDFLTPLMQKLEAARPIDSRAGTDRFVSPDGRNILIRVRGKAPPSNLDYCIALTRAVEQTAQSEMKDEMGVTWQAPLHIHLAGSYAIAAASAAAIKLDMISSVTGSVILLQLLFILAYRAPFKLFALSFGPIALGVLLGFGVYSIYATGLSPMSAVLGGILAGMAIDYSVQYLSMYISRRDAGAGPASAARASALHVTPAALAAWATSIVGFVAVGASSVKSLRDFALLGTLGLTGAFVVKSALLPMLLMLTDRGAERRESAFRFSLAPLLRWIAVHHRVCAATSSILLALAVGVLALAPGKWLEMESDLTVMHPRPNAAIEAQNLIGQRFGLHDWLIVHLQARARDALAALSHQTADRLADSSLKDEVAGVFGLDGLVPDPTVAARRRPMLNEALAQRVTSDFDAAVADSPFNPDAQEIVDYRKLLHAVLTALPPTIDDVRKAPSLADMLLPRQARDRGPFEAISIVFVRGSTDIRASRDAAVESIRTALAPLSGATLTGLSVMSHDSEQTVRRDLPRLSALALALVAVYLLAHFRDVGDAALSLAPTAFSLVLLLAAMRLAGAQVNMINLVAAPLLIGIDVDYGIFLVSLCRIRQARAWTQKQVIAAMAPVCHAVVICAAATFIGYGSLVGTSVPAIRSLGFAVAVGVGTCLASVLFFAVPILLGLARDKGQGVTTHSDI